MWTWLTWSEHHYLKQLESGGAVDPLQQGHGTAQGGVKSVRPPKALEIWSHNGLGILG